jgi:hypothetical protein
VLTTLTLVWFIVCLGGPFIWQHYIMDDTDLGGICMTGITNYSMYTYLVVALFSFIVEAYLYIKITSIIPQHIKTIIGTYGNEGGRKILP